MSDEADSMTRSLAQKVYPLPVPSHGTVCYLEVCNCHPGCHISEKLANSGGDAPTALYQKSRAYQVKGWLWKRSISSAISDLIPNTL